MVLLNHSKDFKRLFNDNKRLFSLLRHFWLRNKSQESQESKPLKESNNMNDDIINKYRTFLQSISSNNKENEDKTYNTNFGSIKFDNDPVHELPSVDQSENFPAENFINSVDSSSMLDGNQKSKMDLIFQHTHLYGFQDSLSIDEEKNDHIADSGHTHVSSESNEFLSILNNYNIPSISPELINDNKPKKLSCGHEKSESNSDHQENSAISYVKNKRREENIAEMKGFNGNIEECEKFKKVILQVPKFSHLTLSEITSQLRDNIIYDDNDIVALYKPYGIAVHDGEGLKAKLNICDLLPSLAESINSTSLQLVHRLDKETTGILLLSKSSSIAEKLKYMFKNHMIQKSYLAITKGVPKIMEGVIDIPIGESKSATFSRMELFPVDGFKKNNRSKRAISKYKVLSHTSSASLIQISSFTGIKHQIRVHLGIGLNCPILADHKYSYLNKIAPQKLPGDILSMFGMKQPAVRHLPMYLHAHSVNIPELGKDGQNINIHTQPPKFFQTTLRVLRLKQKQRLKR